MGPGRRSSAVANSSSEIMPSRGSKPSRLRKAAQVQWIALPQQGLRGERHLTGGSVAGSCTRRTRSNLRTFVIWGQRHMKDGGFSCRVTYRNKRDAGIVIHQQIEFPIFWRPVFWGNGNFGVHIGRALHLIRRRNCSETACHAEMKTWPRSTVELKPELLSFPTCRQDLGSCHPF